MKLVIRQYLASLREREELDAVLPDLLSQLGLNVFSTPGRGTRQDGVDVAAVGRLDDIGQDKVYLLSIKAGDLTRADWDTASPQSLRPSLNEILDSYIPTRLPLEHKNKEIVICLCFGGEIKEQVRSSVRGYINSNTTDNISFEEWNGDKLADLIQASFLREDLLPADSRVLLRKSLALIDEPEASYKYFAQLLSAFSAPENTEDDKDRVRVLRQISICLWIHFAWSRDADNLEAVYRCAELALLNGWEITKSYVDSESKAGEEILTTFDSIAHAYRQVSVFFLNEKVLPFTGKLHALSSSVRGNNDVDINLRLFELLGRIAIDGIWHYSIGQMLSNEPDAQEEMRIETQRHADCVVQLINNNPALFLPIKDDQAIDLTLACLLVLSQRHEESIRTWMHELINRARFALEVNGKYPCTIRAYSDLLDHPVVSQEYREEKTAGSILYPMIALVAEALEDEKLYEKIQYLKRELLPGCNFQLWFPDDASEQHLYLNSELHGAALSDINVEQPMRQFADLVFSECENSDGFQKLSATRYNLYPIALVACRHYRLPIPVHLMRGLRSDANEVRQESPRADDLVADSNSGTELL